MVVEPVKVGARNAKARPGRERIAFIANPTKPGVAQVREMAYRACSMRYLPEPIWIYTAMNNTGADLAREAVEAGADVLVAIGGDGTVRAVAEAAIETGVPLGIIPVGTGNLLARNLDLPTNDSAAALRAVLDGTETKVATKNVILATGSRPRTLPGLTPDGTAILTSDEILELKQAPKSLIVIGAGAVGIEFASIFARFGAATTVIELLPRVLPWRTRRSRPRRASCSAST